MADAYRSAGIGAGFAQGLRDARSRGQEDEDRAAAAEERKRRNAREDEAGLRDAARFEREKKNWDYQDQQRSDAIADKMDDESLAISDRAHSLLTRKRDEMEHDEDRAHTTMTRDFSLAQAKTAASRQDHLWAQNQRDTVNKMREEGLHDLATSLRKGVAPAVIEQEFNARGEFKIQPGSLKHDPATGTVEFSGPQGGVFKGTVEQLEALSMHAAPAPVKLGANDRLIDPTTKKEIVGPSGGGGADGVTKWNRQTASNRAADVVREGLGLKYDSELKQFMIPEGMSEKVGFGAALAGQVTRQFGSRISAEEAGDIALQVTKKIPSVEQARKSVKATGIVDEQEIATKAAEVIRSARVVAAQELQALINDKETELEQREAAAAEGGGLSDAAAPAQPKPPTARPPLASFNKPAQL